MRRQSLIAIVVAGIMASIGFDAVALHKQTYDYKFRDNSRLATGRWVKVKVDESGVYEISHERLREMGFSNPEQVGVYGTGGKMAPTTFLDGTYSIRQLEDDPRPVAVWHHEGKMYFYGVGVADIVMEGGKPTRKDVNQYNKRGTYFLSDCESPALITEAGITPSDDAMLRGDAVDYIYHEQDLVHNTTKNGRLYWGEDFAKVEGNTLSWTLNMPYGVPGSTMTLDFGICVPKYKTCSLDFQMCGVNTTIGLLKDRDKRYVYSYTAYVLPANKTTEIKMVGHLGDGNFLGMDYWLAVYGKTLGALNTPAFVQERLYLRPSSDNVKGKITVPEGSTVFDVSDCYNPVLLPVEESEAYFNNVGASRSLVVFDAAKEQKQVSAEYEVIPNQNLHGLAKDGYDFLIFAVPEMRQYAERIADLHRRHDGIRVLVVDPEMVYNEFSDGKPDPMAFRMMAKMLYHNTMNRLKNILFVGPFHGDYRGIDVVGEQAYGFCVLPEAGESTESENACVYDYPGYASDYLPSYSTLSSLAMEMGVGILAINNSAQGELAVNKVREYLEDLESNNFAQIGNETVSISCPGDENVHDKQACDMQNLLLDCFEETTGAEIPHSTIIIDEYGHVKAHDRFAELLNRGKLYSVYFGHADSPSMAGQFWQSKDFINLKNRHLGFMLMAGCNLSVPDKGLTGIGEICVTEAPRGLAGCVTTSRTVYSNLNYEYAKVFAESMFRKDASKARTETPTIGEIYARSKTMNESTNELCFFYVGDPALKYPVSLMRSTLRDENVHPYKSGEQIQLSGEIYNSNGTIQKDFSGEAVIKITEPVRKNIIKINSNTNSANVCTGYDTIASQYRDNILVSTKVKVTNGRYIARLILPTSVDRFLSVSETPNTLPVYVCAYDPINVRTAAGSHRIALARYGEQVSGTVIKDTREPSVTVSYDSELGVVLVAASDTGGMLPGVGSGKALRITLDGKDISLNNLADEGVDNVHNYEVTVPVAHLNAGDHVVTAIATDIAGNASSPSNYKFNVPEAGSIQLRALQSVAVDRVTFRISGARHSNLRLLIRNADGAIVYDKYIDGTTAVWECEGMPAGLYSASVYYDSHSGNKEYSNREEFSIID